MPNLEKLLMCVTRNGQLQPTHFRHWAEAFDRQIGYSGSDLSVWLRELADTLEEIYAEVIEKYKEE